MLSMDNVQNLSELLKLYEILDEKDALNSKRIIDLQKKEEAITANLERMNSNRPNINKLIQTSHSLTDMVFGASVMAQEISSKVRQLDLTKNRVRESADLVNSILILKDCSEKLEPSIMKKDYAKSTALIQKYLNIDRSVMELAADILKDDKGSTDLVLLDKHHKNLVSEISENFKYYLKVLDHSNILKFLPYFKYIGKEEQGLENLAKYICMIAVADFYEDLIKVEGTQLIDNSLPLEVCIKILETYAAKIKLNEKFIHKYYGKDKVWTIIKLVLSDCQAYFNRALNALKFHRKWEKMFNFLASSPNSDGISQVNEEIQGLSLSVQAAAGEVSTLNSRINLFFIFLKKRCINNCSDVEQRQYWMTCDMYSGLKNLINSYIQFEQYVISEMISKAVQLEEIDNDSKAYRYVEDVIFIIKKTICRSVSSGNVLSVQPVLQSIVRIVEEKIIVMKIASKIRAGIPSNWFRDAYSASATKLTILAQGATQPASKKTDCTLNTFLTIVNTIMALSNSLENLIDELRSEFLPFKANCSDDEWLLLMNTLGTIKSNLLNKCEKLYSKGFQELVESTIRPQIKAILESFKHQDKMISDETLEDYAVNDPWVGVFINKLEDMSKPFRIYLSETNYKHFIELLNKELSISIEKILLTKSMNRNGGIQFDKEVRNIISYMTSISDWTTRDMLSRLSQIAILLNLDNLEEGDYYWNSPSWKIPPNDVRKFLTIRTDFETSAIQRLMFNT